MLRASTEMASPHYGLNVRRVVLALSALLAAVGLYWIGRSFVVDGRLRFGNPVEPVAGLAAFDPRPRQVRAEVTRVRGAVGVREGDMCEFLIERRLRDRESFYCNTQIVCGGRLLYGGPDRGFFACRLSDDDRSDIVGSDPSTTSSDQDGAMQINAREGVMRIWDDAQGALGAFEVEAEVLSVQ